MIFPVMTAIDSVRKKTSINNIKNDEDVLDKVLSVIMMFENYWIWEHKISGLSCFWGVLTYVKRQKITTLSGARLETSFRVKTVFKTTLYKCMICTQCLTPISYFLPTLDAWLLFRSKVHVFLIRFFTLFTNLNQNLIEIMKKIGWRLNLNK